MSQPAPTTRTVHVVQRAPVLGDVTANARVVADTLDAARRDGVDLVVFPELFLTGYHVGDEAERLTTEAAAALDDLAVKTTGLTAVVGAPVRNGDQRHISAVVLDDGEWAGAYHKTHLFDAEVETFDPGDTLAPVETSSGTLGVEICYDLEFPEVTRTLTLGGADLLVTISANMHPFAADQRTYHRARAKENVRPHVVCNRVGTESGVAFAGASGVVDERGRTIVSAGENVETEIRGEVTLGATGAETLTYLDDRRPDLYGR